MNEHALEALRAAMVRLADGDRLACSFVFSQLWPQLRRFCLKILGSGPDAEDAAQVAIEKVFAQAGEYDGVRSPLTWAFAIASWECRTLLQQRRRKQAKLTEYAAFDAVTTPTQDAHAVEHTLRSNLAECIQSLSETDQATLVAAFFDEPDVAHEPAFRKRKERALARLREAWGKLYGG